MHRRSLLRTSLATAGLVLAAGCNGLFDGRDEAAPPLRTETPSTQDDTTPTRPYRAPGAPTLDRPRGIRLRNTSPTERFVTLVVRDGDADAFVDSWTVGAGQSVTVPDVVATAGTFQVVVETADGSRGRTSWAVEEGFAGLWVGVGAGPEFRRLALCTPGCSNLSGTGTVQPALEVRADVGVTAALDRAAAVVLDNDTSADTTRTARLELLDGPKPLFDYEYRLPPRVRAFVPIRPSRPQYRVRVRTVDGESHHDWFPGVRERLYATLGGAPSFRCGLIAHALTVGNETDAPRQVTVRVSTGETALFERRFDLDAGSSTSVPAAVDAAGVFEFAVETDDGRSKTVVWNHCAPNGRLVISVRDQGILVAARPELDSS